MSDLQLDNASPIEALSLIPGLVKEPLGDGKFIFSINEITSVLDGAALLASCPDFSPLSSLFAHCQTQGRGRKARSWSSPKGHIYAALSLPPGWPFDGTLASIATSYLVSRALDECLGLATEIKWPNDIIFCGKKVGGILLEKHEGLMVAGIGLNLGDAPPIEGQRHPLAPPAAGLPVMPGEKPLKLWEKVARSIISIYNHEFLLHSSQIGWEDLKAKLESRLYGLNINRPIEVLEPGIPSGHSQRIVGLIVGLESSGELLIKTQETTLKIWSGTLVNT
ncbi:MAG: hypothetical protein LBE38_02630 [Deltaproteobacteria bacterium]|jgi:BirA family biotin operon repressor/biotin-[acetyl-CoA-carboxylase] ligase|nr:hypothetical protein [Deltaproteobacteria bacterium]